MKTKWKWMVVPALALLALGGCKDANLGPTELGTITGQVLDYDTGEPIGSAGITTTPPSESLLTDEQGRFALEDLEVGSYQVTARKSGYSPTTVAVAVRDDRTATAVIFLEEEDEEGSDEPALSGEVTNFWNTVSGDSTFVEAEYRVRNTGSAGAISYEVYFEIETSGPTYYHEEAGQSLGVGQTDVKRFRTYIQQDSATAVTVTDIWLPSS